jgi:predicted HicB family RNase H-like nuclease
MKTEALRKFNIYMRPEQKAAMQIAAAKAGMSVSAWGRRTVHAALAEAVKVAKQTAELRKRMYRFTITPNQW